MRWDELKIESEEGTTLPGYKDPAVVRHFDAPEAIGTRFYEVRAKSALNAVPKASQMPFRWTINPYRGCSHACVYCLGGETPILMGDGRTKPLSEVRVGDAVYGTVKQGAYRRYAITHVLDRWQSMKPAYRVTLEDGTEFVSSGDHRFLTHRGWKHVVGAQNGRLQRPHLTLNDELLGTGGFANQAPHTDDYRRGYLCGMVRGDANLGSYSYARGERQAEVHRFRLALADLDGLRRTKAYLRDVGVPTREFEFQAAGAGTRRMRAIRNQTRAGVAAIHDLIAWPRHPSDDWCKGFLAGIFDAEGGCTDALRISNCDAEIIDWTAWCLRRFRFDVVIERSGLENGLAVVRTRGGLKERLRFFHTVDPAITRKRGVAGIALKSDARLGVASIECLDAVLPLYDLTTGTGDFVANGVVSHNCFARPTHTYLGMNAGRDFEREIIVKVNVPEILRAELRKPSWKGEHVALGTNTDPYQWVEGRYKLMPGIWEAFRDFRNPCSVLTKSPLLLRDLPLMKEVAEVAPISANLSIPTIDEKAWRATEPHTPNPRARMEAVAELNRAGIPTGILVAPLMPGINDSPEQVDEILQLAADAGAVHIGGIGLHLRGEVRDIFFDWLRSQRPDLVPRYEALYARGAYLPKREKERLSGMVAKGTVAQRRFLRDRVNLGRTEPPPPKRREPEVVQPSLF
jgi:DNA repair photolyase